MNKLASMVRVLLVGFGCVVLIAMWCIIKTQESKIVYIYITDPNYIQSPFEAQEKLKAQGLYMGKIDGIWGPESDKAFCDYSAIQTFKNEYYEKNTINKE